MWGLEGGGSLTDTLTESSGLSFLLCRLQNLAVTCPAGQLVTLPAALARYVGFDSATFDYSVIVLNASVYMCAVDIVVPSGLIFSFSE